MLVFKDYIINQLPDYILDNDSYKDQNGKGFVQRYLEIFGDELDEELYNKVEGLLDLNDPDIVDPKFLEIIGYTLGDIENISQNTAHYRNILKFLVSIYQIKGTIQSIKSILYAEGLTVTVIEIEPETVRYDDGHTYDEEPNPKLYDTTACVMCSEYELEILGSQSMTSSLYARILYLVKLVEPINARLTRFNYNTLDITQLLIEVWIDENGDLNYNNEADPDLVLTLDAVGNLIISGPRADRYLIDPNGNLIYLVF